MNRILTNNAGKLAFGCGEMISRWVSISFSLIFILGVVECAASTVQGGRNWPTTGMSEFCKGDEPLVVGAKAARQAARLKPRGLPVWRTAGYSTKFQEKRELRDKAQCIFSAHAKRGDPNGMYFLAVTFLAQTSVGSTTDFRQPQNSKQEGLRLLKEAALKGHGKAFIKSLKIPAQRRMGYNAWIKQAAAAGHNEAQYELGTTHLDPRPRPGIPRDAIAAKHG